MRIMALLYYIVQCIKCILLTWPENSPKSNVILGNRKANQVFHFNSVFPYYIRFVYSIYSKCASTSLLRETIMRLLFGLGHNGDGQLNLLALSAYLSWKARA